MARFRDKNRGDVLVGDPPWLSYRCVTYAMQKRLKSLARDCDYWDNETTATSHQELAGAGSEGSLWTARMCTSNSGDLRSPHQASTFPRR